ncbi:MAG: PAS domain S-box protein [Rhizomicrobium sp.]
MFKARSAKRSARDRHSPIAPLRARPAFPPRSSTRRAKVAIGEDGHINAIIGVCYDVTDSVRAEEAREKAQQMYRLMTEEASDIILLYDLDRRILFASGALERVLGRTVEEIEDGGFVNIVHPDDIAEAARIRERPGPQESVTATFRMQHAGGQYIWIETTTRAIYDTKTGAYQNLISVSRDVTARKKQEMETEAARERAEAATRQNRASSPI